MFDATACLGDKRDWIFFNQFIAQLMAEYRALGLI